MPKFADEIRLVAGAYVREAKAKGEKVVAIRAGDIVREMHLNNRTPNVCSALSSRKFLEENQIKLERREGPPSGQSTSTLFTYRIVSSSAPGNQSQFYGLRGAAKEAFQQLGGGKEFIAREREEFRPS